VVDGHSGQFTPRGYLSTVKHSAVAGIEPTINLPNLVPIVSPTRYQLCYGDHRRVDDDGM